MNTRISLYSSWIWLWLLLVSPALLSPASAEISSVFADSSLSPLADKPASPPLRLTFPQQLTADLGSEISPSVSPDGRWLLYASTRSGNYDLWLRSTAGGVPQQLTTHPGDDYAPTWAPQGNRIYFVSTREDPQGDIYELKILSRGGNIRATRTKAIVQERGPQLSPSLSRDGRFLAYQEGRGAGAKILLRDLRKGQSQPLSEEGFLQPHFSPLDNRLLCISIAGEGSGGAVCIIQPGDLKHPEPIATRVYDGAFPAALPCWAPDGRSFVAALVNQDRDGDGLLTPLDGESLYRFDLQDSTYIYWSLSLQDANENYPFWADDDFVYFMSDLRGNSDLWRVPANSPIPAFTSAEEGLKFVRTIGGESSPVESVGRQYLAAKLMVLERVRRDFPENRRAGAQSLLESARILRQVGRGQETETYLKRIPRLYPEQRDLLAEAEIDYQMQIHAAQAEFGEDFSCENPISFISNLGNIQKTFPEEESALARTHYLIGSAWELVGNFERALAAYTTVADSFPRAGDYPALALLRTAGLFLKIGSGGEALSTYLDEIRRFSDRSAPTERAIDRILELQVSGEDPIAGLQGLIGNYPDLPALSAAAQKRIADLLARSGDAEFALEEYNRLKDYAQRNPLPYVRIVLAQGLTSAALLEYQRGEDLLAQIELEEVEQDFSDFTEGFYSRQAHHLRVRLLAERAETLNQNGDYESALAAFSQALVLDPEDIRLHRGRITAGVALGEVDDLVTEYRRLSQQDSLSAARLYSLGLCLSYAGEKNAACLAESNAQIQKALSLQPDLAYGYLTLSYNYEMQEKQARRLPPRGTLLVQTAKIAGRALTRLGRFLTFQGEPESFQGYEEAIEILQLGLAVNDENTNPDLEAQMLLNLGNNYYQLGEFGYPRALQAYLQRLTLDTTFVSAEQEAVVRERLGQAAAIGGNNLLAKENYLLSLDLYHRSKHPESELRVLLRLAELFQVINEPEESNSYYRQVLALADREGFPVSRTKWWENMAFNALHLGDDQTAAIWTQKALAVLPELENMPPEIIRNPLVLEVLGIPLPLLNFGYLGTGSPMSALGFTQKDELLLNYSISQEVLTRQKEIPAARTEVMRRLAIALQRQDYEAEANLWSEIGYFDWLEGKRLTARRSFLRSMNLCREYGFKGGRLSALINLACLELEGVDPVVSELSSVREEIALFAEYGIGLKAEEWANLSAALDKNAVSQTTDQPDKILRRALSAIPDPERESAATWDWALLARLLLLEKDPFPTDLDLARRMADEIADFEREPLGFETERARCKGLYAKLCLRIASELPDSSIEQQFEKMQWEGEAFWALENGIKEAERHGLTQQEVLLRLELSDFLLTLEDLKGSAGQLAAASSNLEKESHDDLLWRVYWRFGRICREAQGSSWTERPAGLSQVLARPPEEWLDLAEDLWNDLPEESNVGTGHQPAFSEAWEMYNLALQQAVSQQDLDRVFHYAQKMAALPAFFTAGSRMLPIQAEKRKFVWGAGGGTVPYLRREIQRQKQELARLSASAPMDSSELLRRQSDYDQTLHEYRRTMEQVSSEDPEFASLFSVLAIPGDTLKQMLAEGDLLLQIFPSDDDLRVLKLDKYGISLLSSIKGAQVRILLDSLPESPGDKVSAWERHSSALYQLLFGSLNSQLHASKRLFLVVSGEWTDVPYERFWTGEGYLGDILPIYRLPDAQSLYYLQDKLSLGRGENLGLGTARVMPEFQYAALADSGSLRDRFEKAGAVFIQALPDSAANPLDRTLFLSENRRWQIKDLFGLDCSGDVLILQGRFQDEGLVARAGIFAGFSSVMFLPEEISAESREKFLSAFLAARKNQSPGEAFRDALKNIKGDISLQMLSTKFRIYGNGGLNQQERGEFALNNFQRTILKGNYNLERGDGAWALRYYDRALSMAYAMDDSLSISKLLQLRIRAARLAAQWKEAARSQQALIDQAKEHQDVEEEETGLRNLSVYQVRAGETAQAIKSRLQARKLALEGGSEIQAARDDQILATLFEKMGDYESADTTIRRARQVFENWEEVQPFVQCGIYLGRLYLAQENYREAIREMKALQAAITRWGVEGEQQSALPAEFYQNLGVAYEGLTDYDRAAGNQLQALQVLGDSICTVSALSHQYLAGVLWKQGRFQEGLEELSVAKDQFLQLGNKEYLYLAENTEALITLSLGNLEKAGELAKNALEGASAARDAKSRSQIEKNLGLIELAAGQPEKAKIRFSNSLESDRQSGSTRGQAHAAVDLGNAFFQLNELDSARIILMQALELGRTIGEARVQARSLLGLAQVELSRSNPAGAFSFLESAGEICQERDLQDLAWRVDLALARTQYLAGHDADALAAINRAMNRLENMRSSISAEAMKAGFMQDKKEVYQFAVTLLLKRNAMADAWTTVERARARNFLDLLQGKSISRNAGLDDESSKRQQELSQYLLQMQAQASWLQSRGADRTSEENSLLAGNNAQIDSAKKAYSDLLTEIETIHPGFQSLVMVDPEPPEIIQALLAQDEALLEYYQGRDGLMVFVVTSTNISIQPMPISEDSLAKMIISYRHRLVRRLSVQEEGKKLYRELIAPVEEQLQGIGNLVIIPTGPLFYLPFNCLQNDSGTYLLDHYNISISPAANIFAFCRRQVKAKPAFGSLPLLALGDPAAAQIQDRLLFVRKEIASIGNVFLTQERLGKEAQETALRENAAAFSGVHFSCRGNFEAANPLFSSLNLAPGKGEDGRLQVHEIFDLRLDNCALVTLSACEGGLSNLVGGEEIIALNRAFIYAGSPRVLSSLWKADDLAAAVLIKHFYRNLKEGDDPAVALRKAQILIRERIHPHPSYWAAFVLNGEPGWMTGMMTEK